MIASSAALRSSLVIVSAVVADLQIGALLILLVNLFQLAFFIENGIEGLRFLQQNIAKLFFLRETDRLQLHHFEHSEKRNDHRVARRTRLKKLNQVHAGIFASQNLRTKLRDHLRHGKEFVLQLDARHFFSPFQHLLKYFHQIDK